MKGKFIRAGLSALAICLLVLIFGEIYARIFQIEPDSLITLDSCTGYKSIPNAVGVVRNPGGLIPVATNSAGFRDVEHTTSKPAGTYRVLFLGDSFTESLQVPLQDTFWRQMQAKADAAHLPLEIMTMGVSSFDTAQEMLAYECYGEQYHPDLVVLDYNGFDLLENYFYTDQFTPKFSLTNGALTLDESYKANITKRLEQKDTLFPGSLYFVKDHSMFLRHLFFEMQNALVGQTLANKTNTSDPVAAEFAITYTEQIEDAWTLTGGLLTRLNSDVIKNGGQLLMVNFPIIQQYALDTDPTLDLDKPDMRLAGIAKNIGVPFVDLYQPLLTAQKAGVVHFDGDSHLTPYGHTVVAGLLYNEVLYLRNK